MTLLPKRDLDLAATRARLAHLRGKEYWRTLEELAESDELEELLYNEFPRQAAALPDKVTRRKFLKLMGASLALAGLTGCGSWRQPQERIIPYVENPELIIPGKPLFFATAMEMSGIAVGVLAETHMGRPTKLEGNPDHPGSLGAIDLFTQASILTLYDPDRSQAVTNQGRIRTYDAFLAAIRPVLEEIRERGGAGLRILTETVGSPTLGRQLTELLESLPEARWHQFEPLSRDNARAGAQLAFGEDAQTIYRFDQAMTVLSLDADFMTCHGAALRYARDFAERRRLWTQEPGESEMNRLYVVESSYTTTGSKADHRLPLRASEIEGFARALAAELGVSGVAGGALPSGVPENWLGALARDLEANRGRSIIVVGEEQPPLVHALAHAMNAALGNVGQTVLHTDPIEVSGADSNASLRELAEEMEAGRVQLLMILGGNPAYTAPADLRFAARLAQVPFSVHLSVYQDDTSALTSWHVPMAHYLETWSDARAFDGSVSIVQPLIEPLYQGRSAHEMLTALSDNPLRSGHDIVRETWQGVASGEAGAEAAEGGFDRFWRRALHDGIVPGISLPTRSLSVRGDLASAAPAAAIEGIEIKFRPDPTIYDGRFINNGWLQELPKPISKLTWDNALMLSPATASALGVSSGDVVELLHGEFSVRAPVWVMAGHADNSATAYLGYGASRVGRVGEGLGYNAYAIRTSAAPWISQVEIRPTGETYELATTQAHHSMVQRPIVEEATLAEYRDEPEFAHPHIPGVVEEEGAAHGEPHIPSLYPEYEYNGYRWGMTIDLTTCIGCNACVVACVAENNIPIVGKEEILRSREMHWLRVDTYYQGEPGNPDAAFHMPVPCMHCEKAPCEPVCPVAATVHDAEGLNNMVYNRCVGTRYCSNNCPYKVRRFNFLEYMDEEAPVLSLLRNPDVTIRSRGVMEKCTYCVQRINAARIEARKEERSIREGEVLTACQAACATQAIIFGDLNNEESAVRETKEHPLNYALLAELGTEPRTTYLAAIRNPNPELSGEEEA